MIISIGHFTPIGMRTKVEDPTALVINTCGSNDTSIQGDFTHWVWCNPTNRAVLHPYEDITAVSVECLWQGCKILGTGNILASIPGNGPDQETLLGDWRRGKGKRPRGAYAGPGNPLITSPGEARRRIYIPAYRRLVEHWIGGDDEMYRDDVSKFIDAARRHPGPVFLRDHDTGRGIDRNGPLSHAWVLAVWLNTGEWPN